ncbi:MAG: RluA family pseudouridine synthase [Clostridia bacterium]|nr:RluA family pseudouridine synthase [Clostridia bacterium]
MEKIYEIIANGDRLPTDVKSYLYSLGLSVTLVKKAKYGGILLNGHAVTVRATVNVGDKLEIYLDEQVSEGIPPMDIPLTVLYEDEDILAVDKPTNMPTHPSKGNNLPTLANSVMGYYGGSFVFRSVNRLDRDTSGVVIIAKNKISASALSESMKKGLWNKKYHALVEGCPSPEEGTIDAPIERIEEGNIKRTVRDDGKRAITLFKVIEKYENSSLCEITLLTGRTHQIRVHMSHIGHPLVSDFLYGTKTEKEYFLRCHEISFPHPKNGKILVIKA